MTRDYLYEFLVLARTLNFSQAAQQLFISQATLSRHMAALEKELGIRLFVRDTHSVNLTADGDVFRKEAYQLLKQFDATLSHARFPAENMQGSCRILCADAALIPPLLTLLGDFQTRYVDVELTLDIKSENDLSHYKNDYDICLSTFAHDWDSHDSQLLTYYDAYLIIPRQWSFQQPHIAYFRELVKKKLYLPYAHEKKSPFRELWNKVDVATLHDAKLLHASNIETALLNVSIGRGATILPAYLEQRIYTNSRIVHIENADFKFPIRAYHHQGSTSNVARLLFQELSTQIPIAQA